MGLTLREVLEFTGGRLVGTDTDADPDTDAEPALQSFSEVTVDTRAIFNDHSLFIALRGPRFDGHDFLDEAFHRGAVCALVEEIPDPLPGPVIRVDDTLAALQSLAAHWRRKFSFPLIAITGSNGKTIVKDMLASILGRRMTVYRSPGSYNSQVGVALSLLGLDHTHEVAIIEAGISQPGEMDRLQAMIRPDLGILTNIGLAHIASLKTRETTAREKLKLFAHCPGPVAFLGDEPLVDPSMFHVKPLIPQIEDLTLRSESSRFELLFPDGHRLCLELPVPAAHNVENAALAATMARHLGCDDQAIRDGLGSYSLREMRLQMHTTGSDITLINDAYNADPTSVRAALQVLKSFGSGHRRVAILGDMLDLGGRAQTAHEEIGALIATLDLDLLISFGELAASFGNGAQAAGMPASSLHHVTDFDALHELLDRELRSGDVVLFKASRSIGLDRAAHRLLESVAPTRLTIDLEVLSQNFHALRSHLGDTTGVMAVVKSFAYGSDATRISQRLVQEGVDALAVAYPDEAIPLRRRGLSLPILVTNPRAEEADKFAKYDLDALVYTHRVADALATQAHRRGTTVGVHLAIDTGMHRAGLRPPDVVDFARYVHGLNALRITGLMTHFAAADDPTHDEFTHHQLQTFRNVIADLRASGLPLDHMTIHGANTAAAWRFPDARFDMVRVGLGLYGLPPSQAVSDLAPTHEVLRFSTRVIHLHDIEPGESVGYGRTWTADSPRRLATLAAGYNDGFPRFQSNGGEVLIGGHRCPVVGTVCMDVTVVDVTDAGPVTVGDEALLFGTCPHTNLHLSIDEWATRGHTINYELLCNISPRVRRIFVV